MVTMALRGLTGMQQPSMNVNKWGQSAQHTNLYMDPTQTTGGMDAPKSKLHLILHVGLRLESYWCTICNEMKLNIFYSQQKHINRQMNNKTNHHAMQYDTLNQSAHCRFCYNKGALTGKLLHTYSIVHLRLNLQDTKTRHTHKIAHQPS